MKHVLAVRLFIRSFIRLFVFPSADLCICSFTRFFIHLFVGLSIHLHVFSSVPSFVDLHVSICLSVLPSVYLHCHACLRPSVCVEKQTCRQTDGQ